MAETKEPQYQGMVEQADASGVPYSVGFVVSTGCLHAAGIALGLIHRWEGGRRALRAAGAGIAAGGAWFLWSALA